MSKSLTADQSPAQGCARAWYDAQLQLISTDPAAASAAFEDMKRYNDALRTVWELKVGAGAFGGDVIGVSAAPAPTAADAIPAASHGLTRNQISKVRAVYLMDALATGGPHHTLASLHASLKADHFEDEHGQEITEAALRSHLFRMKDAGYVAVVSTGVYELTEKGFAHRKLEHVAQQPLIERFREGGR